MYFTSPFLCHSMHRYISLLLLVALCSTLQGQYSDITEVSEVFHAYANPAFLGGGVAFIDYDMDGWEDLVMTGGSTPDRLWRNLGNGTFEDMSFLLSKHDSTHITSVVNVGDLNNDGCPDIIFGTYVLEDYDVILQNNCDGTFTRVEVETGLSEQGNATGIALHDFNLDGLLDIYILNYIREESIDRNDEGEIIGYSHVCDNNFLYINQGDFTFVERAQEMNAQGIGCGLAVTVVPVPDRDEYGIFIANDFGPFLHPNQYLVPDESGTYQDEAPRFGLDRSMYGMGIGVGDIDQDLDLDYYVSNLGDNSLYILENERFFERQFEFEVDNTNTPDDNLATSWGTFFLDIDQDTDLDLFVANGTVFSPGFIPGSFVDPNILFLNQDGEFVNTDESFGIYFETPSINRGAAAGDIDNDGDLDIITAYVNFEPTVIPERIYRIYRNDVENPGNFIKIDLRGTTDAVDAYGSKVHIYHGGEAYLGYKYNSGTHVSQMSPFVHFGLGSSETIDSLVVTWTSGQRQVLRDVPINQSVRIIQGQENLEILGCTDSANELYNPLATVNQGCNQDLSTSLLELEFGQDLQISSDGRNIIIQQTDVEVFGYQIWSTSGVPLSAYVELSPNQDVYIIEADYLESGLYIIQVFASEDRQVYLSKGVALFD